MAAVRLLGIFAACLCFITVPTATEETQPFFKLASPWAWVCANATAGICDKVENGASPSQGMSLAACKLTCGKYGMLWPRPRHDPKLSTVLVDFSPTDIQVSLIAAPTAASKQLMHEAVDLFLGQIHKMVPSYAASCSDEICGGTSAKARDIVLEIALTSNVTSLSLHTDESYVLTVGTKDSKTSVNIVAETFFGARHALETLSQLIGWDDVRNTLVMVSEASVNDSPFYPFRSLHLDTSRNYISVEVLRRIMDGMAYNKLNTFHWHITDTHSFPFVSRRNPLLNLYGAYSPSHVYTPEDVQRLVHYATVRGVRIIPEFDAPSHVGNGWQWGPKYGLGELALCINEEPWQSWCVEPPCGQLNPVNEHIYNIIGDIYKDMAEVFQTDMFHMGGDEVKFDCWNKTEDIIKWLEDHKHNRTKEDFVHLWGLFQNRSLERLDAAFPSKQIPILWTSELTKKDAIEKYLDKNRYVLQYWDVVNSTEIKDLYQQGYKIIMSNYDALYMDCGYSAWVGEGHNWCSPYKEWQLIYENSPKRIIENLGLTFDPNQVLGSEAIMWTEQADSSSVETKIWPRAAAFAERVWTEPSENWRQAEYRMIYQRDRLIQRGVPADALQPLWCLQNSGHCYL